MSIIQDQAVEAKHFQCCTTSWEISSYQLHCKNGKIFTNSSETRSYQPGPKISEKLHRYTILCAVKTLTHLELLFLSNFTSALSANYSWGKPELSRDFATLCIIHKYSKNEIQLIQTPKRNNPKGETTKHLSPRLFAKFMDISRGDSLAAFGSEKMTEMDLGESLFETKWWVKHWWTWKTIFVHENYENYHVESQQLVRTKPVSVFHRATPPSLLQKPHQMTFQVHLTSSHVIFTSPQLTIVLRRLRAKNQSYPPQKMVILRWILLLNTEIWWDATSPWEDSPPTILRKRSHVFVATSPWLGLVSGELCEKAAFFLLLDFEPKDAITSKSKIKKAKENKEKWQNRH